MSDTWGQAIRRRITAVGITDKEFASRAGIDRSTVKRATDDDPKLNGVTKSKIERALDDLEDEIGMAESGRMVTSTVIYEGARFTFQGTPEDVAVAIRKMLGKE